MYTLPAEEIKSQKFINNMVSAGTPRPEAVAISMAVEHAQQCPEYARMYGTFLQAQLVSYVDRVAAS